MAHPLNGRPNVREVQLEILNNVHRRQRLACNARGAHSSASSAAHTRVELEELFPREVLNLPDAEDLALLDVLDLRQPPIRVGAQEIGVDRREEDVVELREHDQPKPPEREHEVAP